MKVINKGIFKPVRDEKFNLVGLIPVPFDIEGRELWLKYIQLVDSKMVGSSNYTTDYQERYNLIFQINSSTGEGKSYKVTEHYYLVLQIEIYTWYRPKESIRKEVLEGLEEYPVIYMSEVLDAFMQRDYYRKAELIKIE